MLGKLGQLDALDVGVLLVPSIAGWSSARYLKSLNLNVLICKMEITVVPISKVCCEERNECIHIWYYIKVPWPVFSES